MKKKNVKLIIFVVCLIIIFLLIYIIFNNKKIKKSKIGNNSSSQEIVNYILNISSYEANAEIEIKSNKNTNRYILKQTYISPDNSIQEVIEPSNIQGVKIVKKGNELKLENSKLEISKIYNNYEYMTDNCLDLNSFIEEYKTNNESYYEEKDNQIIMYTTSKKENKYIKYKILYLDKTSANPVKMEIKDDSKKTNIYILYNEIELNCNSNNILAFNFYDMKKEI